VNGEDRQHLIKRLDKKEILCIVATPVFDEGADIPHLKVVLLAGGGKSPIKIIQRIGRGMRRKTEGENEVEIYDFLDTGNRYTKKHSVLRRRLYKQEEFDTELLNWE
jgi:superfamily II DNA or RNA helicase